MQIIVRTDSATSVPVEVADISEAQAYISKGFRVFQQPEGEGELVEVFAEADGDDAAEAAEAEEGGEA